MNAIQEENVTMRTLCIYILYTKAQKKAVKKKNIHIFTWEEGAKVLHVSHRKRILYQLWRMACAYDNNITNIIILLFLYYMYIYLSFYIQLTVVCVAE